MDWTQHLHGLQRHGPGAGPPGPEVATVLVAAVGSTNDLARRIAREYLEEAEGVPDAWVVAREQLAGRGRRERRWSSPHGGIYLTRLLPLARAEDLATLPMLISVALVDVLDHHLQGRCRLKWPNDLMVEGAKLGGVLIEALTRSGGTAVALVGMGINYRTPQLDRDSSEARPRPVTSIEEQCPVPPTLSELSGELMAGIEELLAEPPPADELLRIYRGCSLHEAGDRLVCRIGEEVVEGELVAFEANGSLRLRVGDEERRLSAGEIIEFHAPGS